MNPEQLTKRFEKASHGSGMFELWDAFVTSFAAMLAAGSGNECDMQGVLPLREKDV